MNDGVLSVTGPCRLSNCMATNRPFCPASFNRASARQKSGKPFASKRRTIWLTSPYTRATAIVAGLEVVVHIRRHRPPFDWNYHQDLSAKRR